MASTINTLKMIQESKRDLFLVLALEAQEGVNHIPRICKVIGKEEKTKNKKQTETTSAIKPKITFSVRRLPSSRHVGWVLSVCKERS